MAAPLRLPAAGLLAGRAWDKAWRQRQPRAAHPWGAAGTHVVTCLCILFWREVPLPELYGLKSSGVHPAWEVLEICFTRDSVLCLKCTQPKCGSVLGNVLNGPRAKGAAHPRHPESPRCRRTPFGSEHVSISHMSIHMLVGRVPLSEQGNEKLNSVFLFQIQPTLK